jgi:hypothetical protein
MVLDRESKIAYACPRRAPTRPSCSTFAKTGLYPEVFTAVDAEGTSIYHTNVMMCVADRYVVVCLDSLPIESERDTPGSHHPRLRQNPYPHQPRTNEPFAGNMLQVHNRQGEQLLVMSSQAYASLHPEQIEQLGAFNRILHSPLTTIEMNGGGLPDV